MINDDLYMTADEAKKDIYYAFTLVLFYCCLSCLFLFDVLLASDATRA